MITIDANDITARNIVDNSTTTDNSSRTVRNEKPPGVKTLTPDNAKLTEALKVNKNLLSNLRDLKNGVSSIHPLILDWANKKPVSRMDKVLIVITILWKAFLN